MSPPIFILNYADPSLYSRVQKGTLLPFPLCVDKGFDSLFIYSKSSLQIYVPIRPFFPPVDHFVFMTLPIDHFLPCSAIPFAVHGFLSSFKSLVISWLEGVSVKPCIPRVTTLISIQLTKEWWDLVSIVCPIINWSWHEGISFKPCISRVRTSSVFRVN